MTLKARNLSALKNEDYCLFFELNERVTTVSALILGCYTLLIALGYKDERDKTPS